MREGGEEGEGKGDRSLVNVGASGGRLDGEGRREERKEEGEGRGGTCNIVRQELYEFTIV